MPPNLYRWDSYSPKVDTQISATGFPAVYILTDLSNSHCRWHGRIYLLKNYKCYQLFLNKLDIPPSLARILVSWSIYRYFIQYLRLEVGHPIPVEKATLPLCIQVLRRVFPLLFSPKNPLTQLLLIFLYRWSPGKNGALLSLYTRFCSCRYKLLKMQIEK